MRTRKAVVLAGGRGERVKPITDFIPKALIPINGIPILAQQLRQLERLGFDEVIILTGYLSKSIQNFCEEFPTTLALKCIPSDPNHSPARRLLTSKYEIGNEFLLIYCDNLILSDSTIEKVLDSSGSLTFLIEQRDTGNTEIRSDGSAVYYPGKRKENLTHVELGNIQINSPLFFEVLEQTQDLPEALGIITNQIKCKFVLLTSNLLSISNLERFLNHQNGRLVVILDRDGVLIAKMEKRKYVTKIQDYQPLFQNWKGLLQLADLGVDFIIATNQPGVALGEVNEDFLLELHQQLAAELIAYGINVLAIYVCPHHWDLNCACRKPMPGMLAQAISDFKLDPGRTLYIGDDDRDELAANRAGIMGILIGDDHNGSQIYSDVIAAIPQIKLLLKLVQ
jgi:histidinol-phosphate phosphatase family protein